MKVSFPERATATTVSGLPMNAMVSALPSLRLGKFRLYEVRMAFRLALLEIIAFPWPIQGPQALPHHGPMAPQSPSCRRA